MDNIKMILEGLLFICGDEGLSLEMAANALNIDIETCEKEFDELQVYYTNDDRGMEIVRYNNTYKFLSKACIETYAKNLFKQTIIFLLNLFKF